MNQSPDADGIFIWDCPNCNETNRSPPPQVGDELNCTTCGYTDEIAHIDQKPRTPLGHLAGRLGFPDHATTWTYSDWVAYLFNTTALGIGSLIGVYHLFNQNWLEAGIIFGVLIPLYFWLQKRVDAPRHR